jgi:hypothetical protein
MLNKTEQSDCAPNANEKQEDCYCSALPKGSLCLGCYTRSLAGSPRGWPSAPTGQLSLAEKDMPVEQMTHSASVARLAATRDCHAHA